MIRINSGEHVKPESFTAVFTIGPEGSDQPGRADQPALPCCTAVTDSSLTFPLQAVEPNETCSAVFWFGGITSSQVALTGLHVPSGYFAESPIRSMALATPSGGSVTRVRGFAGFSVEGWPILVAGVPAAGATPGEPYSGHRALPRLLNSMALSRPAAKPWGDPAEAVRSLVRQLAATGEPDADEGVGADAGGPAGG